MQYDVVALGELLIDFVAQVPVQNPIKSDENGYLFTGNPGGAPANFLACLSKMGRKTAFIGKVGTDMFGEQLKRTLQKHGIATEKLILDERFFTTLAFVQLDAKGERSFSFARKPGADTMLSPDEIDEDLFKQAHFFHFGSLSLTQEPCKRATKYAVQLAKQAGCLLSFDPNYREGLWKNTDAARKEILWGIKQCNWLKISNEECAFLWGKQKEEAYLSEMFKRKNLDAVLLTKGEDGAVLATRKACIKAVAPNVHPIDTTGAGDICTAAALSHFFDLKQQNKTARLTRTDIQNLPADEIQMIVEFAVTAGSLSTEKSGAIPSIPTRTEIKQALKNQVR